MTAVIVAAVVVIFVIILAALKAKQPANVEGFSFESRETLFSPAERSFLGVLEQSIDKQYRIFGKVRLGDLVKPAKGLSKSKRTITLNKINQKHLDFVICSAKDLAVVGVIELDDQSHGREDRADRDTFLDQALTSAKIPILRFTAQRSYSIPEVRAKLAEMLKLQLDSIATVTPAVQEAPPHPQPDPPPLTPESVTLAAAPVCPKCYSTMVKRQAKNGPYAGKLFWACSTFPKCRQVLSIEVA